MPTLAELLAEPELYDIPFKLRQRTRDLDVARIVRQTPPGLLARIGRILDWPGRQIRKLITGKVDPTGRDVLRRIGIIGRNRPGFDIGDLLGFLTEVVTDPLTYVTGVGALTKAGKGAATAQKLAQQAKTLRAFERTGAVANAAKLAAERVATQKRLRGVLGELMGMGAARRLGPTWTVQAAQEVPQRALLSMGLPFTRLQAPMIVAPKAVGLLERMGVGARALPGVAAAGRGLGRFFRYRYGVPEEAKTYFDIFERLQRAGIIEAGERRELLGKLIPQIAEETRIPLEELQTRILRGREAWEKSKELGRRAGQARKEAQEAHREAARQFYRQEFQRRQQTMQKMVGRRIHGAERLESMAAVVEPYNPAQAARLSRLALQLRRHTREPSIPQSVFQVLYRPLAPRKLTKLKRVTEAAAEPGMERFKEFVRLGKEAKWAQRSLLTLSPESYRVAHRLGVDVQKLLAEEIATGARAGTNVLRAMTKAYAERVLTPEARKWLRESGKEDMFYETLGKRFATTRTGSQIKRQEDFLEIFTDEANEWFSKNKPDLAGHWFEVDPAKSYPQRLLSGRLSIAAAQLFHTLADRFGNLPHTPGQTMSKAEFLARGPLHRWRGQTLPKEAGAIERILGEMGEGASGIPRHIAEEALRLYRKIQGPEEVNQLLKAVDAVNALFRFSVTIPFPAFHIRNLFGDTTLSWLGDGANLRLIPAAWRLSRDPQWIVKMTELGTLKGSKARDVLEDILGQAREQPLSLLPRGLVKKGEKLSQTVENFTRTWHFISKKAQGMTDMEAARSVRRWLLDYSELTPFEREVMRRGIFFYQWPRKVLPLIMSTYLEKPQKMALLTRGITQPTIPREDIGWPEEVRRGVAIPLGQTPQGEPIVASGLGSPLEEISKLDLTSPEGGVLGGIRQIYRQVLSNLSPPLRYPLEVATGKEFYRDKPILDQDRAMAILSVPGARQLFGVEEEELPGGRKRWRGDPMMLHLLRNVPISRLTSTIDKLVNFFTGADPRMTGLGNLLQLVSGLRLRSLDPVDQLVSLLQSNQAVAEAMIRRGTMGRIPMLFAKRGLEGEKAPEATELLSQNALLRQLLASLKQQPAVQ